MLTTLELYLILYSELTAKDVDGGPLYMF